MYILSNQEITSTEVPRTKITCHDVLVTCHFCTIIATTMARKSSQFVCQQCGYVSPNFLGKCPECGNWNTMVEQISENPSTASKHKLTAQYKSEIVNTSDIEKKGF